MKKITQSFSAVSSCIFLLACTATYVTSQQSQNRRQPASKIVRQVDSNFPASVPSVLGMSIGDAQHVLERAGFKSKTIYLREPDGNVRAGHVVAMNPIAGAVAPKGSEVELRIPSPAVRQGKGNLSVSDADRRMGFDLDEGRYEEILRGADIVIRRSTDGRPSVGGCCPYVIEASDGAVLLDVGYQTHSELGQYEIETYPYYLACQQDFTRGDKWRARVGLFDLEVDDSYKQDQTVRVCVKTSKKQLAIIEFKGTDNLRRPGSYLLRWALFKNELPLKEVGNPPAQRTESGKPLP